MPFTNVEILLRLDQAFNGIAVDYPELPIAFKRNMHFLQLEHIHEALAASYIHLFADEDSWAIVFEKDYFNVDKLYIGLSLYYIGNCIEYRIVDTEFYKYVDNLHQQIVIGEELDMLSYDDETRYQLIRPDITEIPSINLPFKYDAALYKSMGIDDQLDFTGLARFIADTNPAALQANNETLRTRIPADLPHLLSINKFHYATDKEWKAPSSHETYQLIAKVLTTRDPSLWQPTEALINNHWRNWKSGI